MKYGGRRRNRTLLAQHQPTVFRTVWRPFTGIFRMSKNVMVAQERVELSCPKVSVSKTDAYPGSATWPWRTPWEANPPWAGLHPPPNRLACVQKLLKGNNNCTRRVATKSVPSSAVER